MKVATWNLERPSSLESPRVKALLKAMRPVAADVWVLTETHRSLAPGAGYQHWAESNEPDRESEPGERWAMIWSRLPIISRPATFDPPRTVAARIHPPVGADILVYASVLPWLGSAWGKHAAKNGGAFAAALATQHADWTRLQRDNPGCELVVVGDLNQDFSDQQFYGSRRNRHALLAALVSCGLVPVVCIAGDPVRRHAPTRASVDHICVPVRSCRWRPETASSWPRTDWPLPHLTDHFGLSIEAREGEP